MPELTVPLVRLIALCERAVRHRRQIAREAGVPEAELRSIRFAVPFLSITVQSSGWGQISLLIDTYAGTDFRIWWHPGTDRLRLQRLGGDHLPVVDGP